MPAFGAALVSYSLRSLRFFYFLKRSGVHISVCDAIVAQVVGFSLTITPGRIESPQIASRSRALGRAPSADAMQRALDQRYRLVLCITNFGAFADTVNVYVRNPASLP